MSRIGKLPISIPAGVTVAVSDENVITVKGPKGELSQKVDPSIAIVVEDSTLTVKYADCETYAEATKQQHAFHGLYRALINNMVIGVSEGFRKELELVGVGYRVNDKPNNSIELLLGFTHPIYMQFPAEVKIETKSERNKNLVMIYRGVFMWFFKVLEFLKWLIALVICAVVFFAIAVLNTTAFAFEGEKEYYLYTPSSQAQIKKEVAIFELPFLRGESVRINGASNEILEETLARYGATVVKVEECSGGVSYYCYSSKLKGGLVIDGMTVNLQIAMKGKTTVLGTPIIFGGY